LTLLLNKGTPSLSPICPYRGLARNTDSFALIHPCIVSNATAQKKMGFV
jgi:hypothetical protein